MQLRAGYGRGSLLFVTALLMVFAALTPVCARAQDDAPVKPEEHGRKYKGPPATSHIEVTVLKGYNKKPVDGAHVVFHPVKDGKDEGNLELKTDPDGKASIDVIPTGSAVRIQVIADGFATFAEDYTINETSRAIVVTMQRPKAQVSTYIDNSGKPAEIKPGVQDPVRPKIGAGAAGSNTSGSATPDSKPPQ